jgi:hypothetical protein
LSALETGPDVGVDTDTEAAGGPEVDSVPEVEKDQGVAAGGDTGSDTEAEKDTYGETE